ncbi:hypothetical protein TRFO_09184 [Tritrichomonas foetus]|uniref:Uncharacterized protein n=1 Tax=Tritrichomonas foetus TaxID=1144522 RepID=A0A1J4JKD5_9EUKA|nr:hypothetical protein TRFO_09184 [Tritrichomonas foetus]|eukprot:OHS98003.1 hypothetical protein TRFO_09184 [Tritrichomonas foetus]
MFRPSTNRRVNMPEFSLNQSAPIHPQAYIQSTTINFSPQKNQNVIRVSKKRSNKKKSNFVDSSFPTQFYPAQTAPQPPKESNQNSYNRYHRFSRSYSGRKAPHFRAAEQIRGFMTHFNALEQIIRDFLKNNIYFNNFAGKWKSFKDASELFTETASVHFSSNYDNDNNFVPRPIPKTSPIFNSSNQIIDSWSLFLDAANEINEENENYYILLNEDFENVLDLIQMTRNSLPALRFRTDVACIKLDAFQNHIVALNEEIIDSLKNGIQIDEKRLHQQISFLNREVFEIFTKALKHSSVNLAVKIKMRTDLSSALGTIEESIRISAKTGEFIRAMNNEIYSTNRELKRIFSLMNYPYNIELSDNTAKENSN